MPPLTRRTLLASAAGACAAALWPFGFRPAAPAPEADALSGARHRRYAQLVAAVAALEGGGADRPYLTRATTAFAGWYERNAGLRPMADHVLDEVAAAGGARTLLCDATSDGDCTPDSRFGTHGGRRRILAADAFSLASPPFAPDRA